mgnify:CR=1 FL=1
MPSYVYDPQTGVLVDKGSYYAKKFGEIQAKVSSLPMPYVRGDLPTYISPVTGKPIEGRAARREDLARSGCREVDPSEKPKGGYTNYEFCQKRRLPFRNGDIPPPMTRDEREWAKEKRAKAKSQEKLFDMGRAAAAADRIDPELAKFKRGNTKSAPIFKNNTIKEA